MMEQQTSAHGHTSSMPEIVQGNGSLHTVTSRQGVPSSSTSDPSYEQQGQSTTVSAAPLIQSTTASTASVSSSRLPDSTITSRGAKPLNMLAVTSDDVSMEAAEPTSTTVASDEPSTSDKKKDNREKRVLPARLRRVSSLLTGSGFEEEIINATEAAARQRILPESTVFILSSRQQDIDAATEATSDDVGMDQMSFFADPDVVRACREKATIETPDFKMRDDASQMGKTRRIALKSEEDTSDAAYERRHRRPDNVEKKQRRMEKERLIRDRQRLKDRIEQLKTVDPRMLVPIIAAREQQQQQQQSSSSSESAAPTATMRGAEAAMGLGKQHLSAEASANLEKVEKLRKELVAEATETLGRYDALLTEVPAPNAVDNGKRKASEQADDRSSARAGNGQTSSSAQRVASSSSLRRAATEDQDDDYSPPRPRPRVRKPPRDPADGPREEYVMPVHNHYNIHARTSGGKFAPKSALLGGAVSPPRPAGRREDAVRNQKPRLPRPSELARKAARDADRADGAQPSGSRRSASRLSESRQRWTSSPGLTASSWLREKRLANRIGPSLSELDTSERRPKRVKLRLGARPTEGPDSLPASAAEESPTPVATAAASTPAAPVPAADPPSASASPVKKEVLAEDNAKAKVAAPGAKFAAPGALSLAQAQAMMAAAMAQARGEQPPSMDLPASSLAATGSSEGRHPLFAADSPPESDAEPEVTTIKAEHQEEVPSTPAPAPAASGVPAESSIAPVDQPLPPAEASASSAIATSSTSPTTALAKTYMPGRSMEARQRAAASIPSRRSSGRVKDLVKGAFGEKLPNSVGKREDFDRKMLEVYKEWHPEVQLVVVHEGSRKSRGKTAEGEQQQQQAEGSSSATVAVKEEERTEELQDETMEGADVTMIDREEVASEDESGEEQVLDKDDAMDVDPLEAEAALRDKGSLEDEEDGSHDEEDHV